MKYYEEILNTSTNEQIVDILNIKIKKWVAEYPSHYKNHFNDIEEVREYYRTLENDNDAYSLFDAAARRFHQLANRF